MNRYDEEQRFLPALQGEIVDDSTHDLTPAQSQALADGQHLANVAMSGRGVNSRALQNDTAVSHAVAHLIVAAPVVGSLALVTSGLVLLGWLVAGGPVALWIGVDVLLLGGSSFVALSKQRRAGLEHTPAGVERHDIDVRGQVAMYAIDRNCEMVERLRGVRK